MTTFLTDAKASGTLPNIISWHELRGAASIAADVAAYRSLETSLGIGPLPDRHRGVRPRPARSACPDRWPATSPSSSAPA